MNGNDLKAARETLGLRWAGRRLASAELGRALRLQGKRPGDTVIEWERGSGPSGPASVAIEMMLAGAAPPDPLDDILTPPIEVSRPTRKAPEQ